MWRILLIFLPLPALADAVVATRAIRPQMVITAEDVTLVAAEIPGALNDMAEAIGQEVAVAIYPGRPVLAASEIEATICGTPDQAAIGGIQWREASFCVPSGSLLAGDVWTLNVGGNAAVYTVLDSATPVGEMTSRIGDVITRGAEEDVEIETPGLRRPRGREIPLYQPRILGKLGESESA